MSKYSYDEVPYKSFPYRQSHPERLSTVASLHGIDTADLDNCRVLEIGCASGGNLLPMADRSPKSEFVGIDLSQVQINKGLETVSGLGIQNVRLIQADVCNMPDDLGREIMGAMSHACVSMYS